MTAVNYDYKAKHHNVKILNRYMLAKTLSMFEWEGLPETIPYKELEKMLQTHGYAFITEHEGELYCFTGGLGGVPDVYGNPTEIVIANPALKLNKTYNLKDDGVLIYNDDMGLGLLPLYTKHHTMMVENDINMIMWGYNSRSQRVISASDDKTKDSAQAYLDKLIDGDLGVIGENAILEGVKVHGANSSQGVSITTMIEFHQYQKASLYNEVGLSANFNMKRERLVSGEIESSEDSLFPFVFDMMKCRIKGLEAINEKYGTSIDVDFGSVWHFKNKQFVDDVIDPKDLPKEAQTDELDTVVEPSQSASQDLGDSKEGEGERSQAQAPDLEAQLGVNKDELSEEDKQALEDLKKEQEDDAETK
nr:Phage collar connector [Acinetobacter phage Phanie]